MGRSPRPGERRRQRSRRRHLGPPRPVTHPVVRGLLLLAVASGLVPVATVGVRPTAAGADDDATAAAVAFLLDQQAPDGGFGPGVLTPDAVSAIAQQAQRSGSWSAKEAIDAVAAVETANGTTPLDALDAAAQADPTPEAAAQLISRAVVAMGLDPENFDPAADGDPVDLVELVATGRGPDGSYGSLHATAEAVLALALVGGTVDPATVSYLEDAQQDNGGWNSDGDPGTRLVDPATTGLVVEALVAAGVPAQGSTPVTRALAFLARAQQRSGGWPAARDGAVDPVATARAMGAIRAAGYDPAQVCWRDAAGATDRADTPPADALTAGQTSDGAIAGGIDPVASTALGVQALIGHWLPISRAAAVPCAEDTGSGFPITASMVILVVLAVVLIGGSVSIMRRGSA